MHAGSNGDHAGFENGILVPVETQESDINAASEALYDGLDDQTKIAARGLGCMMAVDMVRPLLIFVLQSRGRPLECDLLASVFGIAIREGITDEMLAKKYGVSKQYI